MNLLSKTTINLITQKYHKAHDMGASKEGLLRMHNIWVEDLWKYTVAPKNTKKAHYINELIKVGKQAIGEIDAIR